MSDRRQATEATLMARRAAALGPAYRLFYRNPVRVVRASGVDLFDDQGNGYLDAYNNVASVGHCHPRVVAAIAGQAAILNTHTRYLSEDVVAYAERLLGTMPPDLAHVMFTCSGSEANDLALRMARTFTGAEGVIVTENAYHGVTEALAELSPSTGNPVGRRIRTVPPPDGLRDGVAAGEVFARAVDAAISDLAADGLRPAALLVDTILSSDGIISDPAGVLAPAAAAIRAAGGLFIADEVQPGFGRTGAGMWGFSRHGIAPDIVTMGKPMGAGHPVAAMAARADIVAAFGARSRYFNTFGGNPVSVAAGQAVLDVIRDEDLIGNAGRVGAHVLHELRGLARTDTRIREVRGAGLFIGVELADGDLAAEVVNAMRERFVLISAAGKTGNVLKIRPPLPFGMTHADRLLGTLSAVLRDLTKRPS
jgi:4-aminobutyrate aminotransferase-like enzyme